MEGRSSDEEEASGSSHEMKTKKGKFRFQKKSPTQEKH
jgi:hypothetical protein